MLEPGRRARAIGAAGLLFERASNGDNGDAVDEATATLIAAAVFLERAIGAARTASLLRETAVVLSNGTNSKN